MKKKAKFVGPKIFINGEKIKNSEKEPIWAAFLQPCENRGLDPSKELERVATEAIENTRVDRFHTIRDILGKLSETQAGEVEQLIRAKAKELNLRVPDLDEGDVREEVWLLRRARQIINLEGALILECQSASHGRFWDTPESKDNYVEYTSVVAGLDAMIEARQNGGDE